jgi:soluble lytic murein transglycosylase-like protein
LQINGSWHKWLTGLGIISKPKDLLDPVTNLRAGLAIYNYGVERYGFGWGPWSVK